MTNLPDNLVSTVEMEDLVPFTLPSGMETVSPGTITAQAAPGMTVLGFQSVAFSFFEPGGRDHLLPGRPLEQTQGLRRPQGAEGAGGFILLRGFDARFVTDGGQNLTDRPFGKLRIILGFRDGGIMCRVELTDENLDDPIKIDVFGLVVFVG
jgi:hypothetical protein